ncbi:MAG: MotA/TolQ/ExbB proton channel family protein, partial [Lentisphaeria bacterium]|nr:MotA/TolQ/ExbB proton channel family protein [Lentisphaeria bacterium]
MPYSLALTSTPIYAFTQSDTFGKGIVIFLIGVSIFLWSTMFNKYIQLKKVERENEKFEKLFTDTQSVVELVTEEPDACALQRIYSTGIVKLMSVCNKSGREAVECCKEYRIPRELSRDEADVIVECLEAEMNREILIIEKGMGHIATIVGTSPFLGLLGTVWGVMAA